MKNEQPDRREFLKRSAATAASVTLTDPVASKTAVTSHLSAMVPAATNAALTPVHALLAQLHMAYRQFDEPDNSVFNAFGSYNDFFGRKPKYSDAQTFFTTLTRQIDAAFSFSRNYIHCLKAIEPHKSEAVRIMNVARKEYEDYLDEKVSNGAVIDVHDPAFEALITKHGIPKYMLFNYNDKNFAFPWLDKAIPYSLSTSPDDIFRHMAQAACNIPAHYRNHYRDPDFKNGELLAEVVEKLPSFIEHIIPEMMQRYFPERLQNNKDTQNKPADAPQAAPHYIENETLRLWELKEQLRHQKDVPANKR